MTTTPSSVSVRWSCSTSSFPLQWWTDGLTEDGSSVPQVWRLWSSEEPGLREWRKDVSHHRHTLGVEMVRQVLSWTLEKLLIWISDCGHEVKKKDIKWESALAVKWKWCDWHTMTHSVAHWHTMVKLAFFFFFPPWIWVIWLCNWLRPSLKAPPLTSTRHQQCWIIYFMDR